MSSVIACENIMNILECINKSSLSLITCVLNILLLKIISPLAYGRHVNNFKLTVESKGLNTVIKTL